MALDIRCSDNETIYAEFEYKIPENADGDCATENIVINNSITILIPAGVYDWCIANPTPGDRIWIASANGNVGGRADDYEFRSGVTYEFTVTFDGSSYDQTDVTITDPYAPAIPTDVVVTPTMTTGEVGLGGTLRFKTWNKSSNYPDKIMVYVCDNPDVASVEEFVAISDFIQPTATSADEALQIELDLSGYEGMGHIAFRHYDCYDKWQIYLDDIEVIPANPAALQEWTVVEDLMTPTYIIENLTPETKYEVQVMAFNELSQYSNWTEIVLFETLGIGITKVIDAYTDNSGWYLISSPVGNVDPTTVTNMTTTSDYDFYMFDQVGDAEGKQWLNYEANAFTLVAGQGYLYANLAGDDITFHGTAYAGTGTFELAYQASATHLAGINVMGNPFDVAATVDRAFYTLNPADNTYVEHVAGEEVPAMEGIIVAAETTGENVTFTKGTGEKSANATLNLTQSGNLVDRAIMTFEGRNLPKMQFNPNNTKIYMPVNGKDFAVAAVESFGEMPLNFKAENNGSFTLNFTCEKVNFEYLHLIDNMTGAEVDLLTNPSYSFEAKTTDHANRFHLVFATNNASNSDNFAFVSNEDIIVNGEGMLQMFDVTGRMVYTAEVNSVFRIPNSAFTSGVYVLQLNDKTQKIVVR